MKNTNLSLKTLSVEGGVCHIIEIKNEELKGGGCHISFVMKPDASPSDVADNLATAAKQLLAHVLGASKKL